MGIRIMTIESGFIFAISLVLLWIKPGPGQALKITRALNDGFLPAFYLVLGIIVACEIFFLAAVLGLSVITEFFDTVGMYFKFVGALYLFYLGYKGLSHIEKGVWKGYAPVTHKRAFFENFSTGLFLTLANPLPIFYFLGMMPSLVPIGMFEISDIVIGMAIIAYVGLQVDGVLLMLVTQAKELLSNTKFVRRINIFASVGFIVIGAFFLFSAIFQINETF